MLEKRLLKDNEILPMIHKCYESDVDHMLQYHIVGHEGIENCIYRTVSDFAIWDVKVYSIHINNQFLGYFGEESMDGDKWLTGFFIMPDSRKHFKREFWNVIKNHFNNSFKSGLFGKNKPAKKFLINNGCSIVNSFNTFDGVSYVFEYKEII